MSDAADSAVAYLISRISKDPCLAYHFDPLTESMELLTRAYTIANGLDITEFRKTYYATLRFEKPKAA